MKVELKVTTNKGKEISITKQIKKDIKISWLILQALFDRELSYYGKGIYEKVLNEARDFGINIKPETIKEIIIELNKKT